MKKIKKEQYYTMQDELDYVIDNENVADMKLQMAFFDSTLYGKSENADQFMFSSPGKDDVFFINATLDEVLSELGQNN